MAHRLEMKRLVEQAAIWYRRRLMVNGFSGLRIYLRIRRQKARRIAKGEGHFYRAITSDAFAFWVGRLLDAKVRSRELLHFAHRRDGRFLRRVFLAWKRRIRDFQMKKAAIVLDQIHAGEIPTTEVAYDANGLAMVSLVDTKVLDAFVVRVQAPWRGYICRKKGEEWSLFSQWAVVVVQSLARRRAARLRVETIRRHARVRLQVKQAIEQVCSETVAELPPPFLSPPALLSLAPTPHHEIVLYLTHSTRLTTSLTLTSSHRTLWSKRISFRTSCAGSTPCGNGSYAFSATYAFTCTSSCTARELLRWQA